MHVLARGVCMFERACVQACAHMCGVRDVRAYVRLRVVNICLSVCRITLNAEL